MLEAPARPLQEDERTLELAPRAALRCRVCRRAVCAASSRLEVAGAHAHEFSNPAGQRFRVGCFADAPGARGVGVASDFWSWFDGYRWRVAECRGCGVQLGWQFSGDAGDGFFGLILAALVEPGV